MHEWYEYAAAGAIISIGCYVLYRLGGVRGRREVIHTFDQILVHIYQLTISGKNEELHAFLAQVCGKEPAAPPDPKLVRNNRRAEGYD